MTPGQDQHRRLDELAEAVADGAATAEQSAELQQLIAKDEELRRRYVLQMQMRARLELELADLLGDSFPQSPALHTDQPDEVAPSSEATSGPSRQKTSFDPEHRSTLTAVYCFFAQPTQLSLAVAALFIGLLITAMAFMAPPFSRTTTEHPNGNPPAATRVVARLTDLQDAVWFDERRSPPRGAFLLNGRRLELLEGLAEVTFDDGATVVVTGPAELVIDSADACSLDSGRLAGHVPPRAVGFQVGTPAGRIIDRGTRFGAVVTPAQETLIAVFEGAVDVETGAAASPRMQRVSAGQAVRVAAGDIVPHAADSNLLARARFAFSISQSRNTMPFDPENISRGKPYAYSQLAGTHGSHYLDDPFIQNAVPLGEFFAGDLTDGVVGNGNSGGDATTGSPVVSLAQAGVNDIVIDLGANFSIRAIAVGTSLREANGHYDGWAPTDVDIAFSADDISNFGDSTNYPLWDTSELIPHDGHAEKTHTAKSESARYVKFTFDMDVTNRFMLDEITVYGEALP